MSSRRPWILGGCLLLGCLALGACFGQLSRAQQDKEAPRPALAQVAGRYQFYFPPNQDAVFLDTITGQAWSYSTAPGTGEMKWEEIKTPPTQKK